MSVVIAIFISVFSVIYFVYKRRNRRSNELFAKLPSPPSWPIIGNVWSILDPSERVNRVHKLLLENNGVTAFHCFWVKNVIVSDLEIVTKLYTSNNVKKHGRIYKLFENWIGINVFNAEGELWKKYRSILTPLVHFETIEQYIPIIASSSLKLIENMRSSIGKQINVYKYVELWSINTSLGIGLKLSFATADISFRYVQNVHDITEIIGRRLVNPFKYNDFLFCFTKDYWAQRRIIRFLRNETEVVIKQTDGSQAEGGKKNAKRARTFLDILQDSRGSVLNDKEISDHLQGLLFVGYDTISTSVSCVLFLLSIHQNVQEKVFQEIKSIFGNDKMKGYTPSDLQKMSYLEMVIKESLRLYPPGPFISKYTLEEFRFGDYSIPKETEVFIAISSLHRTPKYFPNPDVFDPERFSTENISNIKPFSYIPFSAGPRNCIAQKVAMLAMKIVLCTILRNYKLLPADGFQLKLFHSIVQKPHHEEVQLKLQNRDY